MPEEDEEDVDMTQVRHKHWNIVTTKGDGPGPLAHHCAEIHGDKMIINGGFGCDGEENTKLWELDLKTYEWAVIAEEGDIPEPRDDHSICYNNGKLYLFGGFVRGKRTNELYEFDCETKKWACLSKGDEGEDKSPALRSGQAIACSDDSIYVFGG